MIYRFKEFVPEVHRTAYIAPTATIIGQVNLAESSSVWFNSILRGDINSISIGAHSNIQDTCVLHVTNEDKVVVGERVTVGHMVVLHGCTIESDCLIGMRSVVLDGAIVKAGSIIAAGALLSPGTVIPEGSLVMGVPGRVVRNVTEEERARFKQNWMNYKEYAVAYADPNVFAQL